jgi:aminoglycoside phosphotransferase (APT) family kinase protein
MRRTLRESVCLPVREVRSTGTVNAIYRLGDCLCARLPRVEEWARDLDKEWQWLPELAPRLSLQIPEIEATEAEP